MSANFKHKNAVLISAGLSVLVVLSGCATKQWALQQHEQIEGRLLEQTDSRIANVAERIDNLKLNRQMLTHVVEGANFSSGSAKLNEQAKGAIEIFLSTIPDKEDMLVVVTGHTDDVGNDNTNYKLGQKRASTVAKYLVMQGLNPRWMSTRSMGALNPIEDNSTREGRVLNRRVDILLYRDVIKSSAKEQRAEVR